MTQQPSIRKKRKLPKRDVSDLKEFSPDINVPIPGSETWISPTAIDSPNDFFPTRSNNKNNHITVGTPTKSRSRHYSKPLSRPSENFSERLQRAFNDINNSIDSGGNCETLLDDDFMNRHSIVPIYERQNDTSSPDFLIPDENSLPEQTHEQQHHDQLQRYNILNTMTKNNNYEPKYNVIPKQVKDDAHQGDVNNKNMKKNEHFRADTSNICLPDEKKLMDTKVQVMIKQLTEENEDFLLTRPPGPLPQQQQLQELLFSRTPSSSSVYIPSYDDDDDDDDLIDSAEEHRSKEQDLENSTSLLSSLPSPQQIIQIPVSERIQTKLNKRKRQPKSSSAILGHLRKKGLLEWTN
ncbi:hypothetical protein INT45_006630 [Circinella minor]|uniref:Uncharacterized protein n=1 Tax=Circinella minor TaxID=1195481 RepID=A0A8H7SAT1_9FUNG|nr:hypothetical protein INT45_006630 [Circinella minor]